MKGHKRRSGPLLRGEDGRGERQVEPSGAPLLIVTRSNSRSKLVAGIAVAASVFHLYSMVTPVPFNAYVQRPVHLLFVLTLAFLLHPVSKGRARFLDYLEVGLVVVFCIYLVVRYPQVQEQAGLPVGVQPLLGAVAVVVIMDATRRVAGYALPILAGCSLLYVYIGQYIGGAWGHPAFSFERTMGYLYLTLDGIWGVAVDVCSTVIVAFTIFGAFLRKAGVERAFTNFSLALAGGTASGPAQVAVISSALFGTVSGSAVANVVATGSFTIPLMRKRGYPPHFAAAVEATASTGGQIMPPIMGAGAFIMAEMLEMPYLKICVAAIIPAMLYFMSCGLSVHFEALDLGLQRAREDATGGRRLLRVVMQDGYLFLPLIVMVYIVSRGISPMKAALYGAASTALIGVLKRKDRMSLEGFVGALREGATGVVEVGTACACAGIVLGVISMTGLGVKLTSLLVAVSGGHMWLALVLTMFAAIVLGMGLPTSVAYVVAAAATAPALIQLGLQPLVAHMFIFYFSILGTITPPVCLSVYAAASLSGANWIQVASTAIRLALPGFMVPYFAVADPSLLMMGSFVNVLRTSTTAALGVLLIASGSIGWLRSRLGLLERGLMIAAGVALLEPRLATDLVGLAVAAGVYFLSYRRFCQGATGMKSRN